MMQLDDHKVSAPAILRSLKRINLISGKGGVGRSTLAATLARASAAQGKKTLLMEIEDDSGWESPLARMFRRAHFSIQAELIDQNLYAMTLSAVQGQEQFLQSFLKIPKLAQLVMSNSGVRWFLEGAPAFREMGYFYQFLMAIRDNYDVLILDLPATGHFIGLARLPEIMLKMMPVGPIAEKLREGQRHIHDPAQTAAWIVTLPQTLPVTEALELKNALLKEKVPLGGFILNKVPFNPFTPAEEKILEGISQKSQTKKLMIDLERIRRYREAEKRLVDDSVGATESLTIWSAPETLSPHEEVDFCQRIESRSRNHA